MAQPQVQGGGDGKRGLQANCLLQFCCIHDSLQFGMQYDHVLKKLNLAFLPHPLWSWEGGSVGKTFVIMLLNYVIPFNLISNMTMFCKKLSFDLFTPSPGSEGGKIFDTMLLHSRSHSVCGLCTGYFAPLGVVFT